MTLRYFCLIMLAGGTVYVCIELLWRGRSHWSMFLDSGLCAALIGMLNELAPGLPLSAQALLGACVITGSELVFGSLFNRSYAVWDYLLNRSSDLSCTTAVCRTMFAGRSARSISAHGCSLRCWQCFWTMDFGFWLSASRCRSTAYSNSPNTPSRQRSVTRTARSSLCSCAACT